MRPELVKNVVEKILLEIEEKKNQEGDILKIWKEVVGERIFRHTKLISFKNGELLVNVDLPTRFYELNIYKPFLLRRLRKKLFLRELRFRIGAI